MNQSLLLFLLLLLFLPLAFFLLLRFLRSPRPAVVPFKGRHVLVTGGSSGIGLEIARLSLLEGASSVSILARDRSRLSEAKASIEKSTGKQVRAFSADVKDFESVKKAVAEIGRVDILICSHGVSVAKTFMDYSLEEINNILDINLRGNLNIIKAILPSMKSRKDSSFASIAIVSSQAGQVGVYGFVPYAASKFGLRGMAEALQQEVIGDNIIISLIYPPDTHTPGLDKENETKPEITKVLSGSSAAVEAVDVAKMSINGIKAGKFSVSCNFDGWMLCIATAGMSPQSSAVVALGEILLMGIMRLVALCVVWNWYRIISNLRRHEKKTK